HVLKQLEQHLGISPAQWLAAVGPCIGANAFTVGSDVFEAFSAYRNCFVQKNANKWTFDLAGTLSQQLRECGVEHIEILNHCTFDSSHGFFSHRAALSKASGRQLSFIGICSENFS
ncbi:MAG: laccase domain-containing protein, partial [Myxococcota bacterium]